MIISLYLKSYKDDLKHDIFTDVAKLLMKKV